MYAIRSYYAGFWGTKFINEKCKGADWIIGLGTSYNFV